MIQGFENLLPPNELSDFQVSLERFSDRCIRLRIDRKIEDVPFPTEKVPWFPRGYWLVDSETRPGGCLSYATADFYIQDAASLLSLSLLDIQPADRVCDLCAAPGGKASAIAEALGPHGALIANEAIQSRIDVLEHNLGRTSRANYAISQLDPEPMGLRCTELFSKVLVDVPCSGQSLVGVGRHDVSAFRPKHIEHCAQRARRILVAGARMLEPGGLLVLSTCTFAIEENEAQVEWLRKEFPGIWEAVDVPGLEPWRSTLAQGCYRLWPHRDRCRGGFAAVLKKVGSMPSAAENTIRPRGKPGGSSRGRGLRAGPASDSKLESLLREVGTWLMGLHCGHDSGTVREPGIAQWLERIEDRTPWRTVRVGFLSGRHAEPTHALALANASWFIPNRELELDDRDALAYMAGQSLPWSTQSPPDGSSPTTVPWVRGTWRGKPIGWLKQSANRWNNHLPAWARMTLDAGAFER